MRTLLYQLMIFCKYSDIYKLWTLPSQEFRSDIGVVQTSLIISGNVANSLDGCYCSSDGTSLWMTLGDVTNEFQGYHLTLVLYCWGKRGKAICVVLTLHQMKLADLLTNILQNDCLTDSTISHQKLRH